MEAWDYTSLAALALLAALWVGYLVEAFRADTTQGMLLLFIPPYLYYYAYVKSLRGGLWRVALVLLSVVWLGAGLWRTLALGPAV